MSDTTEELIIAAAMVLCVKVDKILVKLDSADKDLAEDVAEVYDCQIEIYKLIDQWQQEKGMIHVGTNFQIRLGSIRQESGRAGQDLQQEGEDGRSAE